MFYRALQASSARPAPLREQDRARAGDARVGCRRQANRGRAPRLGWLSAYGAAIGRGRRVRCDAGLASREARTHSSQMRYEAARGSLSCASQATAGDDPHEVARGNSPPAWLYGAVVFDSPGSARSKANRARGGVLPEALARPLGPVLLLWHSIGGVSSASTPLRLAGERGTKGGFSMGALLRSTGGRYVEGPFPSVECDAPGPSEAEALRSTLATYANDAARSGPTPSGLTPRGMVAPLRSHPGPRICRRRRLTPPGVGSGYCLRATPARVRVQLSFWCRTPKSSPT